MLIIFHAKSKRSPLPNSKPNSMASVDDEKMDSEVRDGLLEGAFEAVLDSTKHLDEKIGRLLTGIAFLTAATIALASLATGVYLQFKLRIPPGGVLPLGLMAITTFLLGVFISVGLLTTALTAPLGVPSFAPSSSELPADSSPDKCTPKSQIFFRGIVEASSEQWREYWCRKRDDLKRDRRDELIGETYRLAVRASFKHDRIAEAVAVFSFSLLAFAASAVFTAAAASSENFALGNSKSSRVGNLEFEYRFVLGALFGFYTWLQFATPISYARHAPTGSKEGTSLARRPFLAGLLMASFLIYDESWEVVGRAVWTLAVVGLMAYMLFLLKCSKGVEDRDADSYNLSVFGDCSCMERTLCMAVC
ncbi:hypothetical protein KBZ10_00665 [Streptomyces sp. F63]|uniref:hypothetical protein n=1 Tax=Streptomyces sp. F63 TaxID=2824887 RepID=UPI001B361DC6|nr:hypothetical protein [Streptomyces sp. F63]MBQ0983075.1 hypothetical protein [Streptomyces sp. F63]